MTMTRRQFLTRSAAGTAGAMFGPALVQLAGTRVAYAAVPGDRIVVFVQLYGGNDGLNTVYPLTGTQRSLYEQYRPTLKLPATTAGLSPWQTSGAPVSDILSVGQNEDGQDYALHPALWRLHQTWLDGDLAIINGVHYPFADHSHFRSEDIWYTADPLGDTGNGWFGRYLDQAGYGATDVPAVIMGNQLNPLFTPTGTSLFAFKHLAQIQFPAEGSKAAKQALIRQMYQQSGAADPAAWPELAKIGNTGVATLDASQLYYVPGSGLVQAGKVEALLLDSQGRYRRRNDLAYPSPLNESDDGYLTGLELARDLRHVAATIRADVGARFFHVAVGGFDTHSSQEQGLFHSNLLYEVGASVAAFYQEMKQEAALPGGYTGYQTGDLSDRVLVVTISEFGRTIRQNSYNAGAAGTDHGTSSCQFAIGAAVAGGQHGLYPQLADPGSENEDDLRMTYDFRDFYGTMLNRWLEIPVSALGPGPGKLFPATPYTDADGSSYTAFTPIDYLPG